MAFVDWLIAPLSESRMSIIYLKEEITPHHLRSGGDAPVFRLSDGHLVIIAGRHYVIYRRADWRDEAEVMISPEYLLAL
jgi:hypothetical protein